MSKIEWTDRTWNPVRGCSVVSPGCTNCYAMKFAHRFSGPGGRYEGLTNLTNGGPVWTGKVRLVPEVLDAPLHWRKPSRIFVNSMSDLFHENVPDDYIDRVFAVMALARKHTFQILTKRADRMMAYVADQRRRAAVAREIRRAGDRLGRPHLAGNEAGREPAAERLRGSSVQEGPGRVSDPQWLHARDHHDRRREDDCGGSQSRVDALPRTDSAGDDRQSPERQEGRQPAGEHRARDVQRAATARDQRAQREPESAEGLSQPEDHAHRGHRSSDARDASPRRDGEDDRSGVWGTPEGRLEDLHQKDLCPDINRLDWIIVGGESGPRARPFHVEWARAVVKQCREAVVPVFVKQLGSFTVDRNDAGFEGDGDDDWPLPMRTEVVSYPNWQGEPIRLRLRDRKGGDWNEWPKDLRVREMPA